MKVPECILRCTDAQLKPLALHTAASLFFTFQDSAGSFDAPYVLPISL